MKIDLVVASRELFGADRSAVRLGVLLSGLGNEVRLIVPSRRPDRGLDLLARSSGLEAQAGAVLVATSRGMSGLPPSAFRSARPRPDLTIYNSAAVAMRIADRAPRVLILREWLYPKWLRHRALCALHARRVERLVAVSTGVAKRWRMCAHQRVPVQVCPDWIGDEWLAEAGDREKEGVLFVGRFNAWKGQQVLAEAFARAFANSGRAPSLTFLGAEGPGSAFHREAIELERRCAGFGRVLPFASNPRPALGQAALVVVPSLRPEPFGTVILEALAAGSRVIAFPGGGVDDLAPHFDGALAVVDRQVGALADGLSRWWAEGGRPQAADTHAAVLRTLRERFSAEAVAPLWRGLLDRFVE